MPKVRSYASIQGSYRRLNIGGGQGEFERFRACPRRVRGQGAVPMLVMVLLSVGGAVDMATPADR